MFRFFVIRCMNLGAEIVGRLLGRVVMWMMIAAPGALIFGPIGMYVWPFVYTICCRNSYDKLREKTDGFVNNMIDSVFRKIFTSYWCLSRAIEDQWNEINILIDSCIDLNMRDMFGKSLIIYACEYGMTEIANKLIDKGADVNVVDEDGRTALMCACVRSRTEIADKLIDKGADVNVVDEDGRTALIYACEKGMTEAVNKLIDKGADVNVVDDIGRTPLILACENGRTEIANKLMDEGADINVVDNHGGTALIWACEKGMPEIANKLIDKVADVNVVDIFGRTVLIWACEDGKTEIANKLIDKGADVNKVDMYGRTALIWACAKGMTEIANKLIDKGAEVNVVDGLGRTPLIWACEKGMTEIANKLIDKRADVNVADGFGWTALIYSHDRGMDETASKLIDKGAEIRDEGLRKKLLLTAAKKNMENTVGRLINKEVNIKYILSRLNESEHNTFIKGANKYLIEEIKALNLPLDNIEKEMPGRFSKISDLRKFFSEINKNIKPEENVFDELKNRWREHEYDLNESLLRCINVCRNLNTDEVSSSIDIKGKALESRTVINSISKVDNSRDAYIR